ncbi:hypothetical protein [Mycobacterium sp. 236(2023)]|uniref:LVIVD repeat-containing protein n=1 Tax=Mycobacterium sp. 236(2023) TaxID=3038163 RepID=UPI00241509F6|nr:hypothetical protein [Mycobacterium sp. 236(2023)]MDG4667158.1 hypothetical protein [Mycobacterium sp. 236(2023)]
MTAPGFTSAGVEFVGYHDVGGKPVFKLAMQVVENRWYLYATHFWEPRLSVFDVTDPADPRLVGAIEGPDEAATWQVQVAEGLMVQGLERRPVAWGGDPADTSDEGIRFFDVRDPVSPKLLSQWRTGAHGVHRNHYTGGRYVHVTASRRGFDGNIYVILDVSDREHPEEVAMWFHPQQYTAAGGGNLTGAAGETPSRRISLHGPPYVLGDRAYLSYGAAGIVILDISDITNPTLVSRLDIGAAFSSMIAMHSVVPLPQRNLLLVNTEAIAERQQEAYNFAGIVDVSDELHPRVISLLPIPEPAPDAAYPNFSTRGGRFGPHNQHHPQGAELLADDNLMFMTWFNAGLRIYDISDEYLPREVAWYLPDDPTERRGLLPKTLVTQSEDVLVDARGNIYFSDKNHGLHIVRLR